MSTLKEVQTIKEQLAAIQKLEEQTGNQFIGIDLRVTKCATGHQTWNHSKPIVSDGFRVLQGGINMWSPHYLYTTKPVVDLNTYVESADLGQATTRFIDKLWKLSYSRFASTVTCGMAIKESGKNQCLRKCRIYPEDGFDRPFGLAESVKDQAGEDKKEVASGEHVPIMTLARLPGIDNDFADNLLPELIRHAKKSVDLSQQDLGNILGPNSKFAGAIAEAMRNAHNANNKHFRVRILVSSPWFLTCPGGLYGMGLSKERILNTLKSYLKKGSNTKKLDSDWEKYLQIEYMLHSKTDLNKSKGWGNHTKFISIDKETVYVGSQNAYDCKLQEFGLLYFGKEGSKAGDFIKQRFSTEYFDTLWNLSRGEKNMKSRSAVFLS